MNWQLYVLPPPTFPHGRLSQSFAVLAEPLAERPMHVVAAGIVSVVVVNDGNLIFRVAEVVVTVALDLESPEVIHLQVAFSQYSLSAQASEIVLFSFPWQEEPSGDMMQVYFTSTFIMLLLLHTLYDFGGQSASLRQEFASFTVVVVEAVVVVVVLCVVVVVFLVVDVVYAVAVVVAACWAVVVGAVVVDVTLAVSFADGAGPLAFGRLQRQPDIISAARSGHATDFIVLDVAV
jgi:hypothetical protein